MKTAGPQSPRLPRVSHWGPLLAALLLALLVVAVAWRTLPAPPLATAPAASTPLPALPTIVPASAAAQGASVEAMVQALAARLKQQPDDAAGWSMLGRSYLVMQRHAEAVTALRKSLALQTDDAQTHADLADALAFVAGHRFDGEPERLIRRALQLDPRNAKALELAGTLAFDRKDFKLAAQHWQAALAELNPQSTNAMNLQAGLAQARRLGGLVWSDGALPTAGARISGRITVAPALKSKVGPDDTVFIFARLVDGPRLPVAVLKRRAAELPLDFVLDERSATNPTLRLSVSMQVVVGARISRSGQAAPQSGDLQGFSEPVPVGSSGLQIEIHQAVK